MSSPRLSIGVPVYNGQRFIRATLDSLLAQTFTDFELIICDNCSTDQTEAICREYAARDSRVSYYRNERNLGPAPNYNRCFQQARGELFKWNAADDCCAPDFLQKCIAMLDADPSLVAVYTKTLLIDQDGKVFDKYDQDLNLDSRSATARFAKLVFANHRTHTAHELWGVIRTDALRRTPLKQSVVCGDRILVARWTLLGPLGRVDDHLFLNRDHSDRSTLYLAKKKVRSGSRLSAYLGCGPLPSAEWWDSSLKGKIVFPEWRWLWEYLRAVRTTPLPPGQKLGCYATMAALYVKFLPRLARDLIIAAELLFYKICGINTQPPAPQPAPTSPTSVAPEARR